MSNLEYRILGSVMPMLELKLQKDQKVYSQSGAMQWMDANIKMDTGMQGGMFGALKRKVSGEDMFLTHFSGLEDKATVAFGHTYPGSIIPLDISKGSMICQRRSFLCATEDVDYGVYLQKKLSTGFFGGEGFIMQKLSGSGTAFIEIDGECVEKELASGETIRVETGSVGAFQESVTMKIERVKGIKNMFLGGEGLFLTSLTGPGKVWLQTMPIQSLSGELSGYLPINNS
ncbi:TIGR00266 family protein [Natranaerobius trueperi]|uniref:TIGR00266 family protein n=1 Tax=Natranaerobius trueperi TaxID=759412 RepID=A0A226C0H3_9FIRM|nr:TIGR00266 family protein [Natranaerobius trueperi]OWZ84671.1 TIGR00266 family protein [Natranaerobius trueperi]